MLYAVHLFTLYTRGNNYTIYNIHTLSHAHQVMSQSIYQHFISAFLKGVSLMCVYI